MIIDHDICFYHYYCETNHRVRKMMVIKMKIKSLMKMMMVALVTMKLAYDNEKEERGE